MASTGAKVGWSMAGLLACGLVSAFIYARSEVGKRERVEESLWRLKAEVRGTCMSMRSDELDVLWEWTSERYRNGVPPGSHYLGRLMPVRGLRDSLCGADPSYRRQLAYVKLLVYLGQYGQAATRLYHLQNDDRSTWDALDTTMPPTELAEAHIQIALSGRVPHFHLSAWDRWHPHDGKDSRAHAFTLLDGADRSWHAAVANRSDLFPLGVADAATAERIVVALGTIGLQVAPPAPGTPLLDWAWSALYDELQRLGREAEAMDPSNDELEPLASLSERPFDYWRFRDLLAAVRAEPKPP